MLRPAYPLETDRLLLRPYRDEDLDALHEIESLEGTARHLYDAPLDLDATRDRFVFCGDSPNDAPMFGFFPYACGVANVGEFEGRISAMPAFLARSRGAEGFVEIANRILSARGAARR